MLDAVKFWTPLVLLVVAGCASMQSAGDGAATQPGTEGGMTSIYSFTAHCSIAKQPGGTGSIRILHQQKQENLCPTSSPR